jgi:hypothetical protein
MIRKLFFLLMGIVLARGSFLLLRPVGTSNQASVLPGAKLVRPLGQPVEKKAAYVLKNGVVVSGLPLLKLTQGDRVTLSVTSDRQDSLHLHGYDLKLAVQPNVAASLSFVADRTGRFSFESHHFERDLAIIEVYPRDYVN